MSVPDPKRTFSSLHPRFAPDPKRILLSQTCPQTLSMRHSARSNRRQGVELRISLRDDGSFNALEFRRATRGARHDLPELPVPWIEPYAVSNVASSRRRSASFLSKSNRNASGLMMAFWIGPIN